ncbi:hypothetical protein [Nocardia sp. NBC_01327]|uniref:hypothetical protein n=1 Tax=Nocardia sp. NBC_01327 TaxID=2903593 RepID=UPI002E146AC2|nr:hypothetical protein OG326_38905 [Nocardia sp. NBC_01327]
MKMSVFARSTVGIAAVAAMGVATIVSATTASADMSVVASSAYCVGTTYTATLPAADAATLQSQAPGFAEFSFFDYSFATQANTHVTDVASYVAGQDVTVQWTPTGVGQHQIYAAASFNPYVSGPKTVGSGMINVVQAAPAGASCTPPTPPTGGTGSASSIPVIGGLLSTLSAQK